MQARPVRARADPPLPLDPRHARRPAQHRAGLGADDRRLQVRPDPGRRPPRRHLPPRRARARGAAAALRRLDQRRPARRRAVGVERRARPCWRQFSRCEGRIIVTSFASNIHRVQQVIDAAVKLDRRVALVGRSMRKNFNIASNLGMAEAPSGPLHPAARDRGLPRREGGRDLDRQPGRAALGAAADGQQRPPRRRAALRRHRRLLGDAGARQRARRQRDDRPHLRDRRLGGDRQGRADPRLRPRLAGGAEADAQPDQAALRAAGPRRPPAAAPARRAGRRGRASTPENIFQGRNGLPLEIDEDGARFGEDIHAGVDVRRRGQHRRPRRRRRCATGARSPPTASSSSSRRSPPTTAASSPTPR